MEPARIDPPERFRLENLYSAAASNRASQVADWVEVRSNADSEIVYASHKNVAVARNVNAKHPEPSYLVATPHGQLTALKAAFPYGDSENCYIITCSDDGWLYILEKNDISGQWRLSHSWKAALDEQPTRKSGAPGIPGKKRNTDSSVSVRALGVLRRRYQCSTPHSTRKRMIFASSTSDGQVQIWRWDQGSSKSPEALQRLSLGRSRTEVKTEVLPLDIALHSLPQHPDALLMGIAGTNSKIDLWLADNGQNFRPLFSLVGHTDWIRSLDICQVQTSSDVASLMLASGGQDGAIRLWKIKSSESASVAASRSEAAEADEFDKLASRIEDANEEDTISTKSQAFICGGRRWSISLDALLLGHEHWITGIRWAPAPRQEGKQQAAALLSASADNSVMLWMPSTSIAESVSSLRLPGFDTESEESLSEQNVWVAVQRFGELGNSGSAANGMYGAAWHPSSTNDNQHFLSVMGHGYGGALHIWTRQISGEVVGSWQAQPGRGGHFASANTVRWEPGGQYLISGGSDKTTRLHGRFVQNDQFSWHELARPQTHGYEISALAWLSRLAFASAGDEKTIRVFEAPLGFVDSAETLGLPSGAGIRNTLLLGLNSLNQLENTDQFSEILKAATRRSLASGAIDILVVSQMFDHVSPLKAPLLSFNQAEGFLKFCYAVPWSIAVEAQQLLLDINVYFTGVNKASDTICNSHVQRTFYGARDDTLITGLDVTDITLLDPSTGIIQDRSTDTSQDWAAFPQREAIALGGTFDHLHVGHKILLSIACLLASRRIVVGVTDDSMLTKKKQAELLESIYDRIGRVSDFMSQFCDFLGRPLQQDVVKLQDVAGPAGTESDLTALLFTDETMGGADFIDGVREKNGLQKLDRFNIGVIGADGETKLSLTSASDLAAAKIGSTAIREWIAKQHELILPLRQVPTLNREPRPIGASVPPLGLSNRAIYSTSGRASTQTDPQDGPSASGQPIGKAIRSIASHLYRPPIEEQLHNHSLWSEVTKLYGHSVELLALDVDRRFGLVASSCKANHAELAGVRIHDARLSWKEIQVLEGHSLGVTRLRFSEDGTKLVTVSRDRSWRLFERPKSPTKAYSSQDPSPVFQLACVCEEAHGRIIYDVAWCGPDLFASASRDGTVKIWRPSDSSSHSTPLLVLSVREPVTALAVDIHRGWLVAGGESGHAYLFVKTDLVDWQFAQKIANLHADAIHEMVWQPNVNSESESNVLASAGKDGAVRLTKMSLM